MLKNGEAANYRLSFRSSKERSHAMTLHIHKDKGVVHVGLHDPNITSNMMREKFLMHDETTITKLKLRYFMELKYKMPPDTFSVTGVPARFADEFAGRLVESNPQVQANSIYGALRYGDAAHIRHIAKLWEKMNISGEEIVELLTKKACNPVLGPALNAAFRRGHAEAVKAFGELLKLIPENRRAELLRAKNRDGMPGLYTALYNGRADAVKAFAGLLELIPENQRVELLAAKNTHGTPGLYQALWNGCTEAVKAFGELLKLAPARHWGELLAAKNTYGVPGLTGALQRKNKSAVLAYVQIVTAAAASLSKDAKAALLKTIRNAHGESILGIWINESYYRELIKGDPDFYRKFKAMKASLKR